MCFFEKERVHADDARGRSDLTRRDTVISRFEHVMRP
jgi:hypothetical protein